MVSNNTDIVHFKEIVSDMLDLLRLLDTLGVTVYIDQCAEADLRYYMELHSNMFITEDRSLDDYYVKLVDVRILEPGNVPRDIMEKSICRLLLATYSNTVGPIPFDCFQP
ncbi:hypothetical protein COOONC_23965 [Cooperia oncophora]